MAPVADRPVLDIQNLTVDYHRGEARRVLKEVSLTVSRGEVVGLVGESGSGKSTLAASVLRLLPPAGRTISGRILLDGAGDILGLQQEQLRRVRGARVGMVFQDPLTSLNPVFRVGQQLVDIQSAHAAARVRRRDRAAFRERAIGMLGQVGLPDPRRVARAYPHELSGGMRQRVVIAAALTLEPDLLIADEVTSALDVTTQAQVLALLGRLQQSHGMAVLLVTHDLGVVAETCDRMAVMYAGQVVEQGPVRDVLARPAHPYTQALLGAIPRREHRKQGLVTIPGQVPLFAASYAGCRFASRCAHARPVCHEEAPRLVQDGAAAVRCHMADSISAWHSTDAPVMERQ
jgi:peptide/nickel transport system ATP-binding protein